MLGSLERRLTKHFRQPLSPNTKALSSCVQFWKSQFLRQKMYPVKTKTKPSITGFSSPSRVDFNFSDRFEWFTVDVDWVFVEPWSPQLLINSLSWDFPRVASGSGGSSPRRPELIVSLSWPSEWSAIPLVLVKFIYLRLKTNQVYIVFSNVYYKLTTVQYIYILMSMP